jgi:hypothetical protein
VLRRQGRGGERVREVHIVGVGSNETGFVARRYLAPVSSGTIPVFKSANSKLWDLSQQAVQAKVSYCLGHKAKNLSFSGQAISGGSIDCSGWVEFITRSAFEVINTSAAETVFDGSDISTLETHSDGIIAEIGKRTGKTLGGQEVAEINLREGMLIGFDSGQNKWESKDRTYGIDHIVQIVRSPDETLFITQSSGSGKGVNLKRLSEWLGRQKSLGYMDKNRIFAVDPFALADETTNYVQSLLSIS